MYVNWDKLIHDFTLDLEERYGFVFILIFMLWIYITN